MPAFDDIMSIAMPYAKRATSGEAENGGEIVEALATALGRTVARVADGDAAAIDELCAGLESYIHSEAVSTAEMILAVKAIARGAD